MQFRIEVSVLDCTGCGNCADVCPGKKGNKALAMTQFVAGEEEAVRRAADWEYLVKNVKSKQNLVDIKSNAKNSQFAQPLFEFSGACAGCGETPYVKLVSQLFGDRGLDLLKKYGYLPYDLDPTNETVAKGLEYALADGSIARLAKVLKDEKDLTFVTNDYFFKLILIEYQKESKLNNSN